ncbi:MAG: hypothetical protein Q7S44_01795 [bacterium]|nr:hypothetical protein [bacterium]
MLERVSEGVTVRSAAEIRAKFKKRYGRLIGHYKRWQSPQPDSETNPKGHIRWEKSRDVMEHMLRLNRHWPYDDCPKFCRLLPGEHDYDEFRLWEILRRLATPIHARLNTMIESQRRKNWVESPTNAKQTLRAVQHLDDRLTRRLKQDREEYNFELDELREARESGSGFSWDGSYKVYSLEQLAALDRRIEELEQGGLEIDLSGPQEKRRLEAQREKYLDLLPPHYREKYGASQDTKLLLLQR